MQEEIDISPPMFFSYYTFPVKILGTAEGGMAAWRLSHKNGGWESANEIIDDILFDVGGDVFVLSREEFVQEVERERARWLKGDGPIFALYETIDAIVAAEERENRYLNEEEIALVESLRRKTFRMFEEHLLREEDPAADPSIAG